MNPRKFLIALTLCLCLLGSTACSDDDSSGSSNIAAIEANLEIVMSALVAIIEELEPFPPPTPELGGSCTPIPENAMVCNDGGSIDDCGNGLYTFNNCAASEGAVSILVGGSLQFTMDVEWPTGTRSLALDAPGLAADYLITFDGSDVSDVLYSDENADATCTVLLTPTVEASCTLVE